MQSTANTAAHTSTTHRVVTYGGRSSLLLRGVYVRTIGQHRVRSRFAFPSSSSQIVAGPAVGQDHASVIGLAADAPCGCASYTECGPSKIVGVRTTACHFAYCAIERRVEEARIRFSTLRWMQSSAAATAPTCGQAGAYIDAAGGGEGRADSSSPSQALADGDDPRLVRALCWSRWRRSGRRSRTGAMVKRRCVG